MAKYSRKIVVFLDILGFSSLLPDFEKEALENNDSTQPNYRESESLNRLINIFENVTRLIKNENYNGYLFSDNICITVDYIVDETEKPDLFVEIMELISRLMNEFVSEGYFLRGGVDAGWFLDVDSIAIGVPLVNAYKLETEKAIFPRVAISDYYKSIIDDYKQKSKLNDTSDLLSTNYFKKDNAIHYLNSFYYISNFEDKFSKINYLQTYSEILRNKIDEYKTNSKFLSKYIWVAKEFNEFIDFYLEPLPESEFRKYHIIDNAELDFTEEEINFINNLKLQYDEI
ncbi:MAG: hypothetical protein KGZ58_07670 [Ignavibacteriales bacterium]|nr:hypothetical protein [Ignavibacteriales bacterium]